MPVPPPRSTHRPRRSNCTRARTVALVTIAKWVAVAVAVAIREERKRAPETPIGRTAVQRLVAGEHPGGSRASHPQLLAKLLGAMPAQAKRNNAASYDAATRDALPERAGDQQVIYVFPAGNSGAGTDNGLNASPGTISAPGPGGDRAKAPPALA